MFTVLPNTVNMDGAFRHYRTALARLGREMLPTGMTHMMVQAEVQQRLTAVLQTPDGQAPSDADWTVIGHALASVIAVQGRGMVSERLFQGVLAHAQASVTASRSFLEGLARDDTGVLFPAWDTTLAVLVGTGHSAAASQIHLNHMVSALMLGDPVAFQRILGDLEQTRTNIDDHTRELVLQHLPSHNATLARQFHKATRTKHKAPGQGPRGFGVGLRNTKGASRKGLGVRHASLKPVPVPINPGRPMPRQHRAPKAAPNPPKPPSKKTKPGGKGIGIGTMAQARSLAPIVSGHIDYSALHGHGPLPDVEVLEDWVASIGSMPQADRLAFGRRLCDELENSELDDELRDDYTRFLALLMNHRA